MKFQWEELDDDCQRTKVMGGWILRSRNINHCNTEYTVESMVFIPDPEHKWQID